jgi:uncharacterized membrane protein YozB (DUF420 family)
MGQTWIDALLAGWQPLTGRPPMIFAVKAVMTLATLCFAVGYASRQRDNRLHRLMMMAGFVLTLTGAVMLAAGIYAFGESSKAAYWLVRASGAPERAHWVLVAHRVIAVATLAVLIAQVATGLRRDPLHGRLYPYTIGLWLFTFVAGMFILT